MTTDRGQSTDTGCRNCNDKGRLSSVGYTNTQIGSRIRYKETNNCDSADVEEQDTNIHPADGFGEVAAGVLSFTSGNLYETV